MNGTDVGRVVLGAGASMAVGAVYYSTYSPMGKMFLANMKKSGKPIEGEESKAQMKKAMVGTTACVVGLSSLMAYYMAGKSYGPEELVRFAGRLTVLVGLIDLPHALFEDRDLTAFAAHRGFDALSLFAMAAVLNATAKMGGN